MLGLYCIYIGLFGTGKCRCIHVLYLGRAPRTKETLPDFLKWRRVTRHPLVFRELTGSQRTPRVLGRHMHCIILFVIQSLNTSSQDVPRVAVLGLQF